MTEFLDIPLYDDDFIKLVFRFLHNLIFMLLVVRFAWHPYGKDRQFAFAAVMLNITVFFICFSMKKLELSIGMALGLFAIFGVLRYRTETLNTKDLNYLFIVVGLAVINSLSNKKTSYVELLAVNSTIVAASFAGEWIVAKYKNSNGDAKANGPPKLRRHTITYDRLELLAPERQAELLDDLRQKTYLPIERARIDSIDLPNKSSTLSVWIPEQDNR